MSTIEQGLAPRLFIFPGRLPATSSEEVRDVYNQTYLMWKETWEHVFNVEMNKDVILHSDDFGRQDYIVSLKCGDYIAGTAFIRIADVRLATTFDDSAFRLWNWKAIKAVSNLDNQIAIASYFTIHPEFRRKSLNVCWKTLFLSLYLKHFKTVDSAVLVTATRKLKSNDKLCAKFGSYTLESNLPYTLSGKIVGEETVDLIYWKRDEPLNLENDLLELHNNLWDKRTVSI